MTNWRTMRNLLLIAMAAAAAACASSRAQILEDRPALVVPPVPPREIEPPATVEAPPVEPLPEVAPPPAATTKPPRQTRSTEPKPESKPEPPETPAAPLPTPAPVAGLRTPTTPSGPEATRQIREMFDRASAVLNKIDVQKLSDDRQANYRAAKSFIEQGWDALKKEDLALARSFARRAEDIARQLESSR